LAIKAGEVLRGKYRLDALIGRGGMGQVFAATDLESGADVAIKVVSRVFFDDILMQRLHREAEAAARIRSDFVPRVIEVSDTDEKEVFLVMERLVGEPLSQRLRDRGALSWEEVAQIGEDVLRGLIDAHAAGIVHRDLKPSNVFLAQKGGGLRAMVLDFGVCKMDTLDTERLTATGESIGTVAYMAPEQIRGAAKVDARADLYAFGVLVFEMLTGRLPHDGPTQMAILASKLENEAVRLRDYTVVTMPAAVDEIVTRCLSRDPNQRHESATQLLEAWRALRGKPGTLTPPAAFPPADVPDDEAPTHVSGSLAPPASAGLARPPEVFATQTALTASPLRRAASTRVAFVLAGFALVAGIACVAAFFVRAPRATREAAAAPAEPRGGQVAPSAPSESASAVAFELPTDEPASTGGADAGAPQAPRKATSPRVRVMRPASAPAKSSNQHITSQPRY
jgi:serine/threonine-protein kinase